MKIFVYNLSDYYITPPLNHLFNPKICLQKFHQGQIEHPMRIICNYGFGMAQEYKNIQTRSNYTAKLYYTNVYGLATMYHYRMMTSRYRTTDPKEANLFYIPYYPNMQV